VVSQLPHFERISCCWLSKHDRGKGKPDAKSKRFSQAVVGQTLYDMHLILVLFTDLSVNTGCLTGYRACSPAAVRRVSGRRGRAAGRRMCEPTILRPASRPSSANSACASPRHCRKSRVPYQPQSPRWTRSSVRAFSGGIHQDQLERVVLHRAILVTAAGHPSLGAVMLRPRFLVVQAPRHSTMLLAHFSP